MDAIKKWEKNLLSNFRLENFNAKKMDQIEHKVRITYKLYSIRQDGRIRNCLGTNESLDRLLTRNESSMYGDDKYIVRKVITETHEEPVFKVIPNKRRKKK